MIKHLNLLVILLLLFAACQKEKETPSGMKYKVLKAGDGVAPKKDQIIVFDFVLKDSKDSVWSNTYEEGIAAASMIGDSARLKEEDGMTQMFRMLSKGDSVTTSMKAGEFFRKLVHAPAPKQVDSTSTVTYTVKVQDITTLELYYKKREGQVKDHDIKTIGKYLTDNNLTAQQDTSGLQYILHSNSGGEKPSVDNCVEVKYSGRFLKNGQIFDKADRIAFPLKGVIAGWRLGIPMIGKGDSATLFIPSRLAYGNQGIPGAIPPDAVLIFDVKLLDVKKEYDQQAKSCK